MKEFTLEWWLANCINAHTAMNGFIRDGNKERAKRYARIATYCYDKIVRKYGEKEL